MSKMDKYKETLDGMTFRQMMEVNDYIAEELSKFLNGLRMEVLGLFPFTSKDYVEIVIDDTLEESAEWEW